MTTRKRPPLKVEHFQPPEKPSPTAIILFVGAVVCEFAMFCLFYAVYAETMGLMSDVYMCDIPVVGNLFCAVDDEMAVGHLLSLLLAGFSVGVPIAIFSTILKQKVLDDPQGWISKPTNRVVAIIWAAAYGIVFLLETVNLYTLIAQNTIGGPFQSVDTNALMGFLANNQGLGVFVSVLIAIVNGGLAFMTAWAARRLKSPENGEL